MMAIKQGKKKPSRSINTGVTVNANIFGFEKIEWPLEPWTHDLIKLKKID